MKRTTLIASCLLFAGMLFSPKVEAQVCHSHRTHVRQDMRPVHYVIPAKPGKYHFWVDGYWRYHQRTNSYTWVDGYWAKPKPHHRYVAGYHRQTKKGYRYVPGHFEPNRRR